MSWQNILKKEVDTSDFVSYIVDADDGYNSIPKEKFTVAVLKKINDESVMSKMNESDLLYSKDMLRITRNDFYELFDLSRYLKDLYNKLIREFTKEEILNAITTLFSWDEDFSEARERQQKDIQEKIDNYIVDFIVEKTKPLVSKALQPETRSMIFSGSLPKDAKSKEEAIKKLNNYAAELDIGYYPKLNENATLEQFKKSLGEMEAYIQVSASDYRGYMDGGLGWYHILREIEGFRTLDKLWD